MSLEPPTPSSPLRVGVLIYPGFQALDVFGPLDVLGQVAHTHHITLSIISETLSPVSTLAPAQKASSTFPSPSFEQTVVPTHTLSNAPVLDILIVPGGLGSRDASAIAPYEEFIRARWGEDDDDDDDDDDDGGGGGSGSGNGKTSPFPGPGPASPSSTTATAGARPPRPGVGPTCRPEVPPTPQTRRPRARPSSPPVKLVLSVCTGALLVARSGRVRRRRNYSATTNKKAFRLVSSRVPAVNWIGKARWVEDGRWWSSGGISAGTDMLLGFVGRLWGGGARGRRGQGPGVGQKGEGG
ncbi:putative mfs monocarboxylate transporter [Zalerion maritima]|uniref:Mfs monocarboxylate transporter n=1 Tax=Zalerion maritima TaxID=339359 RepID=A0AAD5RZA1_9PEZI|nr:putative mfs monocarboxylate transporter [Zalerion maritima]